MRSLIFIAVIACGAVWAYDAYEYDGRYTGGAWQQATRKVNIFIFPMKWVVVQFE
jgi:hypothetical protein